MSSSEPLIDILGAFLQAESEEERQRQIRAFEEASKTATLEEKYVLITQFIGAVRSEDDSNATFEDIVELTSPTSDLRDKFQTACGFIDRMIQRTSEQANKNNPVFDALILLRLLQNKPANDMNI